MKNRTDFGLNRRTFLSASGLGLLGASMSGVLCNVPSKEETEYISERWLESHYGIGKEIS